MKNFLKKKQIILAALVLILAGAIYVNWQFSDSPIGVEKTSSSSATASADDDIGKAKYVTNQHVKASSGTEQDGYFIKARADREKVRNDTLADLEEIENSSKASSEDISKATEKRVKLATDAETEASIETLVKAKKFKDCIAVISDDTVNVVVQSDALDSTEILQIQDIILSQFDTSLDNITIINVE